MSTTTRRTALPPYYPYRTNVRRGSRLFINEDTGAVVAMGSYEQATALVSSQDGNKVTIEFNEAIDSHKVDFPLVFVETAKGISVMNLLTLEKVDIPLTRVHWYTMIRKTLYVFYECSLRRINFEKGLSAVTTKDIAFQEGVDVVPLNDARSVTRDPSTSSLLLLSRGAMQLWSYSGSFAPKGQLLASHVATNAFGIVVAKSYDNVVSLLVDSGSMLVHIPAPNDRVFVDLEVAGSALHLDERYIGIGHIDGSASVIDRVSTTIFRSPSPFTSGGEVEKSIANQKSIITWIGRYKNCIVTGSQVGLTMISVVEGSTGVISSVILPSKAKKESFILDESKGAVHVSLVDEDKTVSIFTWKLGVAEVKSPKVQRPADVEVFTQSLIPTWLSLFEKDIQTWTKLDVTAFLEHTHLEQYKENLFENNIRGRDLEGMTQESLKRIGVDALGHRKKFLQAVQALRSGVEINLPGLVISGPGSSETSEDLLDRRRGSIDSTSSADSSLSTSSAPSSTIRPPRDGESKTKSRRSSSASQPERGFVFAMTSPSAGMSASAPAVLKSTSRSSLVRTSSRRHLSQPIENHRGFTFMISWRGEAHALRFSTSKVALENLQILLKEDFGGEVDIQVVLDGSLVYIMDQATLDLAIKNAKKDGKRKLKLYMSNPLENSSDEARQREKLMMEQTPVVLLKPDSTITMVNVAAEKYFGMTAGVLLNKHARTLFADPSFASSVENLTSIEKEVAVVVLCMHKDGSWLNSKLRISRVPGDNFAARFEPNV